MWAAIRDIIDAILAESYYIYEEIPPFSGNFQIHDFRDDGSEFVLAVSVHPQHGWVNYATAIAEIKTKEYRPLKEFYEVLLTINIDRPLMKFGIENDRLFLTASHAPYGFNEWVFLAHLADTQQIQSEEIPKVLEWGRNIGIDFGFDE